MYIFFSNSLQLKTGEENDLFHNAVSSIGGKKMRARKGIFTVCLIGALLFLAPSIIQAGWSVVDIGTTDPLYGIWGSAFDDVFAVGANGTVLHYNGSEWTLMNSTVTNDLQNVWGSSSTDVFAVGNEGTVIHYDGLNWTSMTSNTTARLNAGVGKLLHQCVRGRR